MVPIQIQQPQRLYKLSNIAQWSPSHGSSRKTKSSFECWDFQSKFYLYRYLFSRSHRNTCTYGICTYICLAFMVNVGKYTIYECYGCRWFTGVQPSACRSFALSFSRESDQPVHVEQREPNPHGIPLQLVNRDPNNCLLNNPYITGKHNLRNIQQTTKMFRTAHVDNILNYTTLMLDLRPYPSGLPDAALKAASYVMCVTHVGEANKSKDPSCLSQTKHKGHADGESFP